MKPPVSNHALRKYIRKATRYLTAESAAIAANEITQHYDLACARYRAAGLEPAECGALALRDLGPAWKLRWKYHRTLVNRQDAMVLGALGQDVPPTGLGAMPHLMRVVGAVFACLTIFLFVLEDTNANAWWSLIPLAACAYVAGSIYAERRLTRSGRLTEAIRWHAIFSTIDWSLFFLWYWLRSAQEYPNLGIALAILFLLVLPDHYRRTRNLANKLEREDAGG